jgi:hypothetical protein
VSTAEWFFDNDVCAVASDTITGEVFPPEDEAIPMAVHILHLIAMGLTQGQNFNLEALAADCAEDGRYSFFLNATPEPFSNAFGSPVVPLAIK